MGSLTPLCIYNLSPILLSHPRHFSVKNIYDNIYDIPFVTINNKFLLFICMNTNE